MAIAAGTRLGSHEVVALLGAGGMGEVYRARDSKLGRDVAIKVLPEHFARDPERIARFQREAKMLAALNHPNIAAIYGLDQSGDTHYLVMELVPGDTLAQHIKRIGALPPAEALNIARQIAEALEAAHEKSIIHRDLKPANVKLTPEGRVKVLDFGLAKAFATEQSAEDSANAPTLSMLPTQHGAIMGTPAYMSPEQARGTDVDKRTDIWAFGCVLYELLTGKPAFDGPAMTDILASVVRSEPEWGRLPQTTPPAIIALLRRCLQKDANRRARDAGDVHLQIEEVLAPPAHADRGISTTSAATRSSRPALWSKVLAVAAAALTVFLGVALWGWWRASRPADRPLMRLSIDLGPDAIGGPVVISPDGTRIVYRTRGPNNTQQLVTRLLDQQDPTSLPGTENARVPFFSPDGQWLGFFADGRLQKVSIRGGVPITLCDATMGSSIGADWGEDGNIIAGLDAFTGISRVSDQGGTPQSLTELVGGEIHAWPQILPGGKAVLFTAGPAGLLDSARIEVLSLENGGRTVLHRGGYFGRYLPTSGSAGHLVYIYRGVLFAAPFDPVSLQLQGTPVPVLEGLPGRGTRDAFPVDFSKTGILSYTSGPSDQAWTVQWLDGAGKTEPLLDELATYYTPRVSPEGQRLAVSVDTGKGHDVFVYDLLRGTKIRITFDGQRNLWPVWSADGNHIVYTSSTSEGSAIWRTRAGGGGEPQRLLESRNALRQISLAPDGRHLAYTEQDSNTGSDILILPLDLADPQNPRPGTPIPFARTRLNEGAPGFSPDGRWIAYVDDESGSYQLSVHPFPGPGGKWQVSAASGGYPFWSRDGRQLFYKSTGGIMVVDYSASGDSFVAGTPRVWSRQPFLQLSTGYEELDLAPDGKRFVVLSPQASGTGRAQPSRIILVLNFFDELRRRVKP